MKPGGQALFHLLTAGKFLGYISIIPFGHMKMQLGQSAAVGRCGSSAVTWVPAQHRGNTAARQNLTLGTLGHFEL